MDDVALIGAIARYQDRDAFAVLFDRVAPKIKGYLVFMGLPDRAAEEMALEVMLVVWGRAGDFAGLEVSVYTWIFTIVREVRVRSHARLPDFGLEDLWFGISSTSKAVTL